MKNPPYFASYVEHRKQSKAPPSRMPALSGMLLIPNELLAILRKAFSQGQRINRAIGIPYLRPLVGSLSAIVAAVLLYASNHAQASTPAPRPRPTPPPRLSSGIGIMYLMHSDAIGDPIHHWT